MRLMVAYSKLTAIIPMMTRKAVNPNTMSEPRSPLRRLRSPMVAVGMMTVEIKGKSVKISAKISSRMALRGVACFCQALVELSLSLSSSPLNKSPF